MSRNFIKAAVLLIALLAGSCAIFITDTEDPDDDDNDSVTIIIH